MRLRLFIWLAALAALLVVPPAASAGGIATLKVRSCQTGENSKDRLVTFYARMHAVPGASRMQMRFTLIDRSGDGASLVATPKLAKWRKSRTGVKTFGYAQTITGLQKGGAYAATVEYRWRDDHGRTVKSARRTSGDCRQDGELPNLAISGIEARTGDAAGTVDYTVFVTNRGAAAAHDFQVELLVDGAAVNAAPIDLIEAGETVPVKFSGPACRQRVRAIVDRKNSVSETTEDDNARHSRCPAVAGG
ncbi:MAG: hypothetical protein QOG63_267 [Thermoleophilaceae bacterium]|nr:hypothetical protein [Thermoleophilaceae bacterium]